LESISTIKHNGTNSKEKKIRLKQSMNKTDSNKKLKKNKNKMKNTYL